MADPRHDFIAGKVAESFGIGADEAMSDMGCVSTPTRDRSRARSRAPATPIGDAFDITRASPSPRPR